MTNTYMTTPIPATSVIGRDGHTHTGYIAMQAMVYAIARIQSLPEDRQERSNMIEMCAIVRSFSEPAIVGFLYGVEHHVGHAVDLWPAHGGDDANGLYTDEELDRRDFVRKEVTAAQAKFAASKLLIDAPPSSVVRFLDGEEETA